MCLARIESQLNATISRFQKKMIDIYENQHMLKAYLNSPISRTKRVAASSIAIAIGLLDVAVTTGNFFYHEHRINLLREKIDQIDAMVSDMRSVVGKLVSNQEYLVHEGEIVGIQRNILLRYFNTLHFVHSCDVAQMGIHAEIMQIESRFQSLYRALLSNRLTEEVIALEAVEKLTMARNFDDTVYRVSPIHLYSLSRLSVQSFSPQDITFVVSYPVISLKPTFKQVALLEASGQMIVPRGSMHDNFRFLIPMNLTLDDLPKNTDMIRSVDTCITSSHLVACHAHSVLPHDSQLCLESILTNSSHSCLSPPNEKDVSLAYGRRGVLIETQKAAEIFLSSTNEVLLEVEGHQCVYSQRRPDLSLRQGGSVLKIYKQPFASHLISSLFVNVTFDHKAIKNFSLPAIKNPGTFQNITFDSNDQWWRHFEHPWKALCFVFAVSGAIVILVIVCKCVLFCHGRKFVSPGIDGGIFGQ